MKNQRQYPHAGHQLQVICQDMKNPTIMLYCNTCQRHLEVCSYSADSLVFYIASPLSAATEAEMELNMKRARKYQAAALDAMERDFPDEQVFTYAPHAYLPEIINDAEPAARRMVLQYGLEVLRHCSGLIICGPVISAGMQAEIDFAKEHNIPLYRFMDGKIEFVEGAMLRKSSENLGVLTKQME